MYSTAPADRTKKSSVIIFQTLLFFFSCPSDYLNSQLMIFTYLTRLTLISALLAECLPLPESSFNSSCLSLNLLCLSKTCAQQGIISIHLMKYSKYFQWSFFSTWTKDFKFISFSVFTVCSSMLKAEQPEKDCGYIFPRCRFTWYVYPSFACSSHSVSSPVINKTHTLTNWPLTAG